MALVLYALGGFGAVAGLALIAFGIPNNEFSIGSTLILAGVTSLVGGLIVIGLAAALSQLKQISEALMLRPAAPRGRSEPFEQSNAGVPFPPRPKQAKAEERAFPPPPMPEPARDDKPMPEAMPEPMHWDRPPPFAPSLGKPRDEMPMPDFKPFDEPRPAAPLESDSEPMRHPETVRRATPAEREPQGGIFDGMWPQAERDEPVKAEPDFGTPRGEPRTPEPVKGPAETWKPQPFIPPAPARPETRLRDQKVPRPFNGGPSLGTAPSMGGAPSVAPSAPEPEDKPSAPVLKSGTVDGMGYTLYVDGSIEAELPSGTLRFASIAELRSHLEKNS